MTKGEIRGIIRYTGKRGGNILAETLVYTDKKGKEISKKDFLLQLKRDVRQAKETKKNEYYVKYEQAQLDKLNGKGKKMPVVNMKDSIVKFLLESLVKGNYLVALTKDKIAIRFAEADYEITVTKKKDRLDILNTK